MRVGAQDAVSLANRSRLHRSHPRAARLPARAGAVDHALVGARIPRTAAEFLEGSADAITHVQEASSSMPTCVAQLFGYSGDDALTGTP